MTRGSAYFIIGIHEARVGPFALLGLSPEDPITPELISDALERQLARIDAHPEGATPGADALRQEVRLAAQVLQNPQTLARLSAERVRHAAMRKPVARPVTPPPIAPGRPLPSRPTAPAQPESQMPSQVEEAARTIIEAITMTGGWNRRTPHFLAALADRRDIPFDRLQSALDHLPRLLDPTVPLPAPARRSPVRRSAAGSAVRAATYEPSLQELRAPAGSAPRAVAPSAPWSEQQAHEAAAKNMVAAIVTFVLAAIITLPLGVYVVAEFLALGREKPTVVLDGTATPTPSDGSRSSGAAETAVVPRVVDAPVAEAITDLEAGLMEASASPRPEWLASYRGIVGQAGFDWHLYSRGLRDRVIRVVFSALYQYGEDAATVEALLSPLRTSFGLTGTPSLYSTDDVPSAVWGQTLLALLSREANLPAPAKRAVDGRMRSLGAGAPSAASATATFDEIALSAAATLVPSLAERGAQSNDDLEQWLRWRDVVRTVAPTGLTASRRYLSGAYALLSRGPDLSASTVAVEILTALLGAVKWDELTPADLRVVTGWYVDPALVPSDVWIVSSFLAANHTIAGIDQTYVVDRNASAADRAAIHERLERLVAGIRSTAAGTEDLPQRRSWAVHAQGVLASPGLLTAPERAMERLVLISKLNLAADYLERHDLGSAQTLMDTAGRDLELQDPPAPPPPVAAEALEGSSPVGADGEWTIAVAAAQRANDEQGVARLIGQIAEDAGSTPLGPIDSRYLVGMLYGEGSGAQRAAAAEAIRSKAEISIHLLLALADMMPVEMRLVPVVRVIEDVTSTTLPPPESPQCYPAMRRALLQKAWGLLGAPANPDQRLDTYASLYASTLSDRAIGPYDVAAGTPDALQPADAAMALYRRWEEAAGPMIPREPFPAPLTEIGRRLEVRLEAAADPVGRTLAAQLGVLEAMAYVTASQRPDSLPALRAIMDELADDVSDAEVCATSLQQCIAIEQAILRIWAIRLQIPLEGGGRT